MWTWIAALFIQIQFLVYNIENIQKLMNEDLWEDLWKTSEKFS